MTELFSGLLGDPTGAPKGRNTLDPGSASFQSSGGFDLFPDEDDFKAPRFSTAAKTPAQNQAAVGAATGVSNALPSRTPDELDQLAEAAGGQVDRWDVGFDSNILEGVGDVLGAPVYTIASFINGLQRTGDFKTAMNSAGAEFVNALPGISLKDAKRPGFAQVVRDTGFFDSEEGKRWAVPITGFLLDVVLDPTTWLTAGLGTAFKAARAGKEISNIRRAALAVTAPGLALGSEVGAAIVRHGGSAQFLANAGAKGGALGKVADAVGTHTQTLHRTRRALTKTYSDPKGQNLSGQALNDKVNESIASIKDLKRAQDAEIFSGAEEIDEIARGMTKDLSLEEQTFFALFMDQDRDVVAKHFSNYLEHWKGVADPKVVDASMLKFDGIRSKYKEYGKRAVKAGILAENELIENFAPIRMARDPESRSWVNAMLDKNAEMDSFLRSEGSDIGNANVIEAIEGRQSFQKKRTHKTAQDAIAASVPVELFVGKAFKTYATEVQKALSTRHFLDGVASNGNIFHQIDDPVKAFEELSQPGAIADLQKKGYTLWDPMRSQSLLKGGNGEDRLGEFVDLIQENGGQSPMWIMPEMFAKDMMESNKMLFDKRDSSKLWSGIRNVNNIWKGWALFSPSYHTRNVASGVFQNMLDLGVKGGDPTLYAKAMAVQMGGTDKLPTAMRHTIEGLIGKKRGDDIAFTIKDKFGEKSWTYAQAKDHAAKTGLMGKGLFARDAGLDTMESMMSKDVNDGLTHAMAKDSMTIGAEKWRGDVINSGMKEADADAGAKMLNSMAHYWHIASGTAPKTGSSPNGFFDTFDINKFTKDFSGFNGNIPMEKFGHLIRTSGLLSKRHMKAITKLIGESATSTKLTPKAKKIFDDAFNGFLKTGQLTTKSRSGKVIDLLPLGHSGSDATREAFEHMKDQMGTIYQTGAVDQLDKKLGVAFSGIFGPLREQETVIGAVREVGAQMSSKGLTGVGQKFFDNWIGKTSHPLTLSRKLGTHLENNVRVANWLGNIDKGMNETNAMRRSIMRHFDYDDITEFERNWLRNVMPFYTWQRKNIPLMISSLFEDPARFDMFTFDVMRNIEEISNDWADQETPDYFSEINAVRLPMLYNQKPVYLDSQLPFQDLQGITKKGVMGSLSPFIKATSEWFPDRDINLMTGGTVARFKGEDARGLLGGLDVMSRETESAAEIAFPPFGKINRIIRAAKEKDEGGVAALNVLGSPFGFRINDVRSVVQGKNYNLMAIVREQNKARRFKENQGNQGRSTSGMSGQSVGRQLGLDR